MQDTRTSTGARPSLGRSVKGQSLSDKIYGEIIRSIIDSNIPEGGRLPTEAYYCKLFSVSRTVIRDALSRLKIDGVIASRQGQGSVVLHRPNENALEFAAVESIADMQTFFEFRQLVEGEAAALAAVRHSKDDMSAIRNACEAVKRSIDAREQAVEQDLAFHFAIAKAAHNKFLLSAIMSAKNEYLKGMNFARNLTVRYAERRGEAMHAEHLAIVYAIEARDDVLARSRIVDHIRSTRDRIFLGEHAKK